MPICGPPWQWAVMGPKPNPDGIKWVITWARTKLYYPNIEFKCTTDVPIYLHAEVGCKAPHKIAGEHFKRGVVMHHDPEVVWSYRQSACQEEVGMTTDHTIIIPCYPDCEIHWWRCVGRTTGLLAKWGASLSGFYNCRCEKPPPGEDFCTSIPQFPGGRGFDARYKTAINFKPIQSFNLTEVHICLAKYYSWDNLDGATISIQTACADHTPGGYVLTQGDISLVDLEEGICQCKKLYPPQVALLDDHEYTVVFTPHPWQYPPGNKGVNWWGSTGQPCLLGGFESHNNIQNPGWYITGPNHSNHFCLLGYL